MSIEKDPLVVGEDEELGAEDELVLELDDDDIQVFSCKYCEFQTESVEDLDEHIIKHDEAILENSDDDESEETDYVLHQAPEQSSVSPIASRGPAPSKNFSVSNKSSTKNAKQLLPAFYEECVNKPDKKVFVCPYCGYQSMKKLDMNRHLKEHRQPVEVPVFACSECSYTTRRKCDMPKHLLTHCENGTVPMHKCSECPYATKRKGDLSKHMLCHQKLVMNSYSCSECAYSSKRQGDLKKHIASHENDVRIRDHNFLFNCTECGYTSKRLNDLHKHVVLHCDRAVKGVFKCQKCEYASEAGSHFAKHVLSHCKVKANPVTIFPKDSSMQEYIVVEEEELHLYQLDKANMARVEEFDKAGRDWKDSRKRKASAGSHSTKELKLVHNEEEINKETENSKVVVLTGFVDSEETTAS